MLFIFTQGPVYCDEVYQGGNGGNPFSFEAAYNESGQAQITKIEVYFDGNHNVRG